MTGNKLLKHFSGHVMSFTGLILANVISTELVFMGSIRPSPVAHKGEREASALHDQFQAACVIT